MPNRPTSFIPADPLFRDQWFLRNTGQFEGAVSGFDINVIKVWPDYTGKGILVAAIDNGFDQTHPDIKNNYRADLAWDFQYNRAGAEPVTRVDNHGTAVAGLVVGSEGNNIGGTGVAWGANLVGYRSPLQISSLLSDFQAGVARTLKDGAAISTNSWGPMQVAFDAQADQGAYVLAARQLVSQGRNGLGTVTLFAGGNDGKTFNTNYDPTDNLPYAITVAASKTDGLITWYSTPGASVLVTAPGSAPSSIVTTDRQGSAGYNNLQGVAGDYTNTSASYFNGTSAATPIAAGVVALMLQANPNLGYRDVQEILAYSSKRAVFLNQSGLETTINHAHDWNGGGLLTGYEFGYGNIDALAAVRLAETWQKTSTISNLKLLDGSVQSHQLNVAAGAEGSAKASFSSDARVEQLTVSINLDAQRLQNVKLELISPDGTHSILINEPSTKDTGGEVAILPTHLEYTLNTVRSWGESVKGDWTLKITNKTGGAAVRLNDWSIKAFAADNLNLNTQIFTDELASFSAIDPSRLSISSSAGTSINAAAVSTASILDLSGGASKIGGVAVALSDPQLFTKIITGDGNDHLIGNALDNLLLGGRGSNVMDGRDGIDTAQFIGGRSMYDVEQVGTTYKVTSNLLSGGGIDQLISVEKLIFGSTSLVVKSALDQTESVASMYEAMFNRGADSSGLKFWTNNILDGTGSELAVAQAFTQSSEDNVAALTNAQFVTRMYTDALDRKPDQPGYDFWLNALDTRQATRGQVLLDFIDSDEFTLNELDLIATQIADLGDIWV